MKYPIIVGSHPGSKFLANCVASLRGMEHVVIVNDGYEMGKIREVYFSMRYDRFMFVPDSVEFKRVDWIAPLFESSEGKSVSLCSCPCFFGAYMGIYRREVLQSIPLPETPTKVLAVEAERTFSDNYCRIERPVEMFPDLADCDQFEESFGRRNMVIQNAFITKRKGCFNMSLAHEIDASR